MKRNLRKHPAPHPTIKCFMKFGQKDHIMDMYTNGTIYMNPIQYFRTCEDNALRGDKYEGIRALKNYPGGEFEIKALNFKGEYISLQIREDYEQVLGNIYSLYSISSYHIKRPLKFKINNQISKFGDHCLFIKNNPEFLKRLKEKLRDLNLKFRYGFVDYYNSNKKNGIITLFQKPNEYKYQNEFRFYIERESTQPFVISIGSLEDIAAIYNTDFMISNLQLMKDNEKLPNAIKRRNIIKRLKSIR